MQGKQLLCRAGRHQLITDRKAEDGGTNAGCTSGELLLLAIGSCAAGSARAFLEAHRHSAADLSVDVDYKPSPVAGARDTIVIRVSLPALSAQDSELVRDAVLSGGVVSRLSRGSDIEIQCLPRPIAGQQRRSVQ